MGNNVGIDSCNFTNNSAVYNSINFLATAITFDQLIGAGTMFISNC